MVYLSNTTYWLNSSVINFKCTTVIIVVMLREMFLKNFPTFSYALNKYFEYWSFVFYFDIFCCKVDPVV